MTVAMIVRLERLPGAGASAECSGPVVFCAAGARSSRTAGRAPLVPLCAPLVPLCGPLVPLCGPLVPLWGPLVPLWGPLVPLWGPLVPLCVPLVPLWGPLVPLCVPLVRGWGPPGDSGRRKAGAARWGPPC
jgi:hypothetical protein